MAEFDWKIAKATQACCLCRQPFGPGQAYYSALFQAQDSFSRQDYCAGCFQDKRPENVFYFWKATAPDQEAEARRAGHRRRPVVDIEYVFEFFKRLEEGAVSGQNSGAAQRLAFRYILALMLTRKKMLVQDGRKAGANGGEIQVFREKRGGQAHEVSVPALSPDEVTAVTAELGVLLGLTPPAAPSAAGGASAESTPAGGTPQAVEAHVAGDDAAATTRRTAG